MPHFCADELLAIMMALPFIGTLVALARARWRRLWKRDLPPPSPATSEHEDDDTPSAEELAAQHHKECIALSLGCDCTCRELDARDKERRQRRAMKRARGRSYRGHV